MFELVADYLDRRSTPEELEWLRNAKKSVIVHTGRCGSTYLSEFISSQGWQRPNELLAAEIDSIDKEERSFCTYISAANWDEEKDQCRDQLLINIAAPKLLPLVFFDYWAVFNLFQHAKVVLIRRKDVIAQAASFSMAEKTQVFHRRGVSDQPMSARLGVDEIRPFVDFVLTNEHMLLDLLRLVRRGSDFHLKYSTYEDLVDASTGTVEDVCEFLGVSPVTTSRDKLPEKLSFPEFADDIESMFPMRLEASGTYQFSQYSDRVSGSLEAI